MTNQASRTGMTTTVSAPVLGRTERPLDEAAMSDPTLTRLQGRGRKRRSSLVVSLLAAMLITAVGAAGFYALTKPHGSQIVAVGYPPASDAGLRASN